MVTEKEGTRNRNIGIIISVAVHLVALLSFLFLIAWTAPSPPIPEYGIELKFGLDAAGGADKATQAPQEISDESNLEEVDEQFLVNENTSEEILPQEEVNKESKSATPAITQQSENPVKEDKTEQKVKKTTLQDDVEITKVKSTKSVKEKDNTPKSPNPNQMQATYDKPKAKKDYGDDPSVDGNKGDEEGALDAKALYGNQGGGVGLSLAGWNWDQIPKPYIPHDESGGRIEFEIKVDSNGEIIAYRVLERSLSINAERACREAISKLTFTKKTGVTVPAISVGKITFLVRTR